MASTQQSLIAAIDDNRPLVLLLGQSNCPDDEDAVLRMALERLGKDTDTGRGWAQLRPTAAVTTDFYEWLAERFKRRVSSPSLTTVASLPWNAVFTSSLDPSIAALFADGRREPETILTAVENPRTVRSRVRPPIYHLFSRAGEQDPVARPPNDLTELNRRRVQHSVVMLNRMLETATSLGVVAVDGFTPGCDWLRLDDLLGSLGDATSGQIFWFGGRPQLSEDEAAEFDALVESGRIVVEPERLATVLAEMISSGRLSDLAPPSSEDAGVVTFADGKQLITTPEERLRVEAVASIIDDSWSGFLPPLGPDADYDVFRRFHGDLEGPRLLVEGVRREFAIERDFEPELSRRVGDAIHHHANTRSPIMVKGQSGTGKSVALARLVSRVRGNRLAAVLYSIGRIPQSQEVSEFCEKAEDAGARATVIVCDANRNVDQYYDLFTGLRSRGRRVVVVGSQYYADQASTGHDRFSVEAPVHLSSGERDRLAELMAPHFGRIDPALLNQDNFLAFMYRFLPASRPRIRSGLGDEALATERELRAPREYSPANEPSLTPMQAAIAKAGLLEDYYAILDQEQAQIIEQGQDAAGRIIDWVMVAGSLNCPVPFNLLLRAATANFPSFDFAAISDLFSKIDLFRWVRDSGDSDLLISPRLILEARLICQRRLGSAEVEASRLLDLVKSVRPGLDRDQETTFLLNVLHQMSNDGPQGERYKNAYADIGRQLTESRFRFRILDPRLMLQESAFRRSAIRAYTARDDEHLVLLEEARDSVQQAINGIDNGQIFASARSRQNLMVERATVYGFLSTYRSRRSHSSIDIWSAYEAARLAIKEAVNVSASYYPLDVGLWTPADLIESDQLSEEQRAELKADIYSNLDQVDPEALSPRQRESFESRRGKLGTALGDSDLSESAYANLESMNSTAGYYLRARFNAPELAGARNKQFSDLEAEQARSAAEFLESYWSRIFDDERCLWLLLECRWIAEMRRRPLQIYRRPSPLPWDSDSRRRYLAIVQSMNQASGESPRHATIYLEAVLTWLTGDYHAARQMFRDLARDTDYEYASRVIRRHVMSDSAEIPMRFSGRVENHGQNGRWIVRVDELGQTINLLGHDFQHEEIQYGRTISDFVIAFNFIGPIATPSRPDQ